MQCRFPLGRVRFPDGERGRKQLLSAYKQGAYAPRSPVPGVPFMAGRPINLGPKRISPIVLALIALVIVIVIRGLRPRDNDKPDPAKTAPAAAAGEYLFCFWNVENLFDDKGDKRRPPDEEYDNWFAENTADREKKYAHLAEALAKLNGGKGPDILCLAEVETVRAAELL